MISSTLVPVAVAILCGEIPKVFIASKVWASVGFPKKKSKIC